eukprot:4130001-Lingulodinium_polyedra.AAC.1
MARNPKKRNIAWAVRIPTRSVQRNHGNAARARARRAKHLTTKHNWAARVHARFEHDNNNWA